jgi:hypothetical protein
MLSFILLAQLAGPVCGYNYGVEITPDDSPYVGCVINDRNANPAVRIKQNPFTPSGYQAQPIPSPYQ